MNRCLSLILVLFTFVLLHAQSGFSAFYSDTTSSSASISASITPFIFEVDTSAVILLSASVQQAYEISTDIISESPLVNQVKLSCAAYPNPTTNYLILDIGEEQEVGISYQLYDLNGVLLKEKLITAIHSVISMKEYHSSIYILKVIESNKIVQSFRVIKK